MSKLFFVFFMEINAFYAPSYRHYLVGTYECEKFFFYFLQVQNMWALRQIDSWFSNFLYEYVYKVTLFEK